MLIDTSGFLCFNHKEEPHHEKAVKIYDSASNRLTTNYVLAEYVALASARGLSRKETLIFSEEILSDETVEIIWVDKETHIKAVELLKERRDKNYSLCDAVSFIIMRRRGIAESLTTDKHFEQEGFIRLLK